MNAKRKRRLWSKRKLQMPRPKKPAHDKGFSLRLISEADSRFAVVKEMRQRLDQLIIDAGLTTIQQKWLAARAVFLVAYLESLEVASFEGERIDWGSYVQSLNCLSGALNKLGLDKKLLGEINTLEKYTASKQSTPNGQNKKKVKKAF